jgi:hypothetical protein
MMRDSKLTPTRVLGFVNRSVVQDICDHLSAALVQIGPALIAPKCKSRRMSGSLETLSDGPNERTDLQEICERSLEILQGKSQCQILEDDEEEPQPPSTEQSEWDAALIRDAADLVASLAQVLGPDFAQAFGTFFPTIQSYYDPLRQTVDRSYAIGTLAEIVNGMKSSITPFTESLLQLFVRALSDPELDVRSNAAFAFGSLAYWSEADLTSYYPKFLSDVQPILENPATDSEANQARDNASGAISRLILKNAGAIPMDQVRLAG